MNINNLNINLNNKTIDSPIFLNSNISVENKVKDSNENNVENKNEKNSSKLSTDDKEKIKNYFEKNNLQIKYSKSETGEEIMQVLDDNNMVIKQYPSKEQIAINEMINNFINYNDNKTVKSLMVNIKT